MKTLLSQQLKAVVESHLRQLLPRHQSPKAAPATTTAT